MTQDPQARFPANLDRSLGELREARIEWRNSHARHVELGVHFPARTALKRLLRELATQRPFGRSVRATFPSSHGCERRSGLRPADTSTSVDRRPFAACCPKHDIEPAARGFVQSHACQIARRCTRRSDWSTMD